MLNTAHLQAIVFQDPMVMFELAALFLTFCFLVKTAKEARSIDLLTDEENGGLEAGCRQSACGWKRAGRLPLPGQLLNPGFFDVGKAIPAYRLREQA